MKVCFPTSGEGGLEDKVGSHFGRVPTYTVVDLKSGKVKIIENKSRHRGGKKNPPEIIKNCGADIMICNELGRKAIDMFNKFGIDVYIGAKGKVKKALEDFKNGELKKASIEEGCLGKGD